MLCRRIHCALLLRRSIKKSGLSAAYRTSQKSVYRQLAPLRKQIKMQTSPALLYVTVFYGIFPAALSRYKKTFYAFMFILYHIMHITSNHDATYALEAIKRKKNKKHNYNYAATQNQIIMISKCRFRKQV